MASEIPTEATTPSPDPSLVLFARGVIARLALWHALRLAVEQSWGGPESAQKRTWMASVIVDAFEPAESSETPDADYVEDMLLQIMADEFDTILEDGSVENVARDIMDLWGMKEAEEKMTAAVQIWEERVNKLKGKVLSREVVIENEGEEGSSDEWEDDEDEADEPPQLLAPPAPKAREDPQVDEEGFTTVVKGKRKTH